MRTFETGATRDTDRGKLDYEGFLSPAVLERYARYMHKNRVQADGNIRDSDNWQRGIPVAQYMKSMWRHFMDVWTMHRGNRGMALEEALCAVLFNVMGMLHETIKENNRLHDTVPQHYECTRSGDTSACQGCSHSKPHRLSPECTLKCLHVDRQHCLPICTL